MADTALSRRLSEITGVAIFAASLIWLIALVSFTETDPVIFFNDITTTAVSNFAGRFGAFIALVSFQLVGYSAYLIPIMLGYVGWHYFWCE